MADFDADKKRNKLGYRRISVACTHCRRRKIRCLPQADDPHDRCQTCIRLKKECIYSPVDLPPNGVPAENGVVRGTNGADHVAASSSVSSSSPRTMSESMVEDRRDSSTHFPGISLVPNNQLPVQDPPYGFDAGYAPHEEDNRHPWGYGVPENHHHQYQNNRAMWPPYSNSPNGIGSTASTTNGGYGQAIFPTHHESPYPVAPGPYSNGGTRASISTPYGYPTPEAGGNTDHWYGGAEARSRSLSSIHHNQPHPSYPPVSYTHHEPIDYATAPDYSQHPHAVQRVSLTPSSIYEPATDSFTHGPTPPGVAEKQRRTVNGAPAARRGGSMQQHPRMP